MTRVTKAMLERDIEYYKDLLTDKEHKIELLETELKALKSPYSMQGQVSSMVIAAERLGDGLAHVVDNLKRKP